MSTRPPLQNMQDGLIPIEIEGIREIKLVELLGVGGFSYVWRVVDTKTNKFYSLKIISGLIPGSIMVERVRMEAGVSIDSEYIVKVIGLCEWDASTFLILFEHVEGVSLEKLLEENRLTNEQKRNIFIQVLRGVGAAHSCNVIHRDLKPANILITDDGRVKLIDFGISKFKGVRITKRGEVIGTVRYMAPELIIQGADVADARCDIYSLGHIFYELAMGEHFWKRKGWDQLEDVWAYMDQEPSPEEAIDLTDFSCSFFPHAGSVLARMVKIDVEQRYKTIDEVLKDLGNPLLGERWDVAGLDLQSPLLIIESGENRLAKCVLGLQDGERREFGRFDLAGNDASISRRHLEFSRQGEHYFVRDLGSKHGTLVGGVILKAGSAPVEIRHADHIKVGDVFLRFTFLSKSESK